MSERDPVRHGNPFTEGFVGIRFTGPPGPTSGRFIEVEDCVGNSLSFGEWVPAGPITWAQFEPLHSSTIDVVQFEVIEPDRGVRREELRVQFRGGACYVYFAVPRSVYDQLEKAGPEPGFGKLFNELVKKAPYEYRQRDTIPRQDWFLVVPAPAIA